MPMIRIGRKFYLGKWKTEQINSKKASEISNNMRRIEPNEKYEMKSWNKPSM